MLIVLNTAILSLQRRRLLHSLPAAIKSYHPRFSWNPIAIPTLGYSSISDHGRRMDISKLVDSPVQVKKRPHDDGLQSTEQSEGLRTTSPTLPNPLPATDTRDFKRQRIETEESQKASPGPAGDSKDSGSAGQQQFPNGKGKGKDVDRGGKKAKGGKGGGRNAVERKRVRNRMEESTEERHAEGTEGKGKEKEGEEGGSKRLAKRKIAMLLSFCGTGCSGMQFQHTGERTIEGLLFEAFVKAGAISQDNSDHPAKVDLQRAARTDAGVHAAGNIVSFKMIMEPPIPNPDAAPLDPDTTKSADLPTTSTSMEESSSTNLQPVQPDSQSPPSTPEQVVAHINSFLPPQIRVWSFLRTRNTFNCRKECDSRRYEYLFPSWMLLPPKPGSGLAKQLEEARKEAGLPSNPVHSIWEGSVDEPPPSSDEERQRIVAADLERKRVWRVDEASLDRFRSVLKEFEGTHCFHNYTVGREFSDRAAKRFMMEVSVRSVNVLEDGVEWVSVLFHGQSFMLHQRKMISMALMVCRTETPASLIPETYGPRRITVPMAPALGLLLEQPLFGSYNDRVRSENAALEKQKSVSDEEKANRRRDEIDFSKHQKDIDEFKLKLIYERMREEEAKSNVFNKWIQLIDYYQGEDLAYLNAKGTIVQAAIIKKGERRQNAINQRRLNQGTTETSGNAENMEEMIEDEEEEAKGMKGKDLEEMEG
ncbi:tRNA pseudouridine synthase 1 [Tulasnella sp. 424]|nr:tRNA pseudouridine synthase 1 [Tulasnella sp. 424]